jgi:uncharacterized protein (DUF2235 family)
MAKNIVVCLDGTNNELRAADNTNVVRLLNLLDLSDPAKQVAYYDPGVGTFSSPSAWSPPARLASRYAGLMFSGVHSDVGGMFETGTRLSDIPLKWMADEAVASGLVVRAKAYEDMSRLQGVDPTGPWHKMPWVWQLIGPGRRTVPEDALIHASVRERVAKDPDYAKRLPQSPKYVCDDWRTPRPLPVS